MNNLIYQFATNVVFFLKREKLNESRYYVINHRIGIHPGLGLKGRITFTQIIVNFIHFIKIPELQIQYFLTKKKNGHEEDRTNPMGTG